MADQQKLKCPECGGEFEFDPNSDEQVTTSLNERFRPEMKSNVEVAAYLECAKGRLKPYKVKKHKVQFYSNTYKVQDNSMFNLNVPLKTIPKTIIVSTIWIVGSIEQGFV